MLKIMLLCAGGASTGMLAKRMQDKADELNVPVEVSANAVGLAASVGKNADVIMLGPQVAYQFNDVKKELPDKVVVKIDMTDYGRMNGKGVLKQAIKAYKAAKKA